MTSFESLVSSFECQMLSILYEMVEGIDSTNFQFASLNTLIFDTFNSDKSDRDVLRHLRMLKVFCRATKLVGEVLLKQKINPGNI